MLVSKEKIDEGNDGNTSPLSDHLTCICMPPQASYHQLQAAFVCSQ